TDENSQEQLHRLELHNKVCRPFSGKNRLVPGLAKDGAVNCKTKNLAGHDKLLFKLVRPHLNQAYRNAQTITHMQQKLTLVHRALDTLHLGILVLTADGKVRLATTLAVKHVTNYLDYQCLRGNRLPESLWRWVKRQEVVSSGKDDVLLRRSPLV